MKQKQFTAPEIVGLIREHADSVAKDDVMYQLACRHMIELFELLGHIKTLDEIIDEHGWRETLKESE